MAENSKNLSALTEMIKNQRCRSVLSQVTACSIKSLVLFNVGLMVSFSTIIIPALRGISKHTAANETLVFTNEQASWFGSISSLCELVGCIFSAWATDIFGRKLTLILTTIPSAATLLLLYYSSSAAVVFAAYIIMGIMNGVAQVAFITYTGEVCDANTRDAMVCLGTVSTNIGSLFLLVLGSITDWRTASLICVIFPCVSLFLLVFIPESPVWLISKNRQSEAIKSLQWLRGWTTHDKVQKDLINIKSDYENSKKKSENGATSKRTIKEQLDDFIGRRNMIPFLIVLLMCAITESSNSVSMIPFLIQIFKAFGVATDAHWSSVKVAVMTLIGALACTLSIGFIGKRRLYLIGLVACLMCTSGLAIYANLYLPANWNSFIVSVKDNVQIGIMPLVFIMGLFLFWNWSLADVPRMYMAELFPFSTRSTSSGVILALSQAIAFISSKGYMYLEIGLSLGGAMWFYAIIGVISFPLMYILLPDTEGISMDELEICFADKDHKITDTNIKQYLENRKSKQ